MDFCHLSVSLSSEHPAAPAVLSQEGCPKWPDMETEDCSNRPDMSWSSEMRWLCWWCTYSNCFCRWVWQTVMNHFRTLEKFNTQSQYITIYHNGQQDSISSLPGYDGYETTLCHPVSLWAVRLCQSVAAVGTRPSFWDGCAMQVYPGDATCATSDTIRLAKRCSTMRGEKCIIRCLSVCLTHLSAYDIGICNAKTWKYCTHSNLTAPTRCTGGQIKFIMNMSDFPRDRSL